MCVARVPPGGREGVVKTSSLVGDYAFVSQQMELGADTVGATPVGDFETVVLRDILAIDGTSAVNSTDPFDRIVRRDDAAGDGVTVETSTDDLELPPTFKLNSKGKFGSGELVGAFDPSGLFGFAVLSPKSPEDTNMACVYLRLPPDATKSEEGPPAR